MHRVWSALTSGDFWVQLVGLDLLCAFWLFSLLGVWVCGSVLRACYTVEGFEAVRLNSEP